MAGIPHKPRQSWVRGVVVSIGALAVLLAGGIAYLHTSHGFRHVIVPLVASLTQAEVSVRDGYVSLAGTLAIDGLQFRAPKKGITVEAERIYLSLSPRPIFHGQPPVIRDLEIKTATVVLTEAVKEQSQPRPSDREREGKPFMIPVAIDRAKVDGFTLALFTSGGTLAVRGATMAVEHLGPGRAGSVKAAMNVTRDSGSSDLPVSAAVTLDLALELNAAGTGFKWTGNNSIVLESGVQEPDAGHAEAINVAQTMSGQYESRPQSLNLVSDIAAKKGEIAMGSSRAEVRLTGEDAQQQLQATLNIEGLTAEALSTLLAEKSPAQFESGSIDAQVQVSRTGKQVGMRTALAGHQLSLRHGTKVTPPIDVRVDQVGTFDQESEDLSLETLNVSVSDETRRLVTGGLERPIVMSLHSRSAEGAGQPAGEGGPRSQDAPPPVGLKINLHGVKVQELRPWLALSGVKLLSGFSDGELNGSADLTVLNAGRTVDLTGRLSLTKGMIQDDQGNGILGPVSIQTDTHATLTDFTVVKVERLASSVALKTKQVAQIAATGTIQVRAPAQIKALEGTLIVDGLPLEAVNPLLARHGPARVQHAVLDGGAKVRVEGDRMTWDIKLQGKQVSLRLPDMASPTPPLEVHVEQTGSFDQASRTLYLEGLAIQVLESRRPVIVGTLDKRLVFPLGHHETRNVERAPSAPIRLSLEISRLSASQLRPWTAITGSTLLDHVRSGEVTGQFQINVRGAADQVDLIGNLDLAEFQLERPGSHTMAAPVTIRARLRAAVSDLARIKLDASTVQVLAGPKALAEVNGAGTIDGKSGKVDVTVQIASTNFTETLDRLGLFTGKQRQLIDGGQFKSGSTMTTSGSGQPLTLITTMRLDTLTVKLDAQHTRTHSIEGKGTVVVNADRSEARLDQISLTLLANGVSSGAVTMVGHWPLTGPDPEATLKSGRKPRSGGELAITVKDWDAILPVSFFDVLPGREPGPVPVNLAITMKQDSAQQAVTWRGQSSIGPLHPRRQGTPAETKTLHVEHDVTRRGDDIRIAALTLTSQSPRGRADLVSVSGVLHLGKRPRVQAKGKIETLDAKWFADLLTNPDKPEQADLGVAAAAAAPAAPAYTGKGFPADVDVELEIGSISHRGLKVEQGRLVARGLGGNLHTSLSPTKIAGGSVEAKIDVTMVRGEPQIKWSLRGQQLAVESLLQSVTADGEAPLTGVASFTTNGDGRGSGETLKQSVTGTANFQLNQGRFVKSELLSYVAAKTQIREIEHMGFDAVHGKLHAQDGWIVLDRLHVISPAIVLDAVGRVGLDGRLDVKVSPRVSAGLALKVGGACIAPLLHTVDGFTVFPFGVEVKGTIKQPAYGLEIRAEDVVKKDAKLLVGGLLKTLEGCGKDSVEGGANAVGALKGAAQDLVEGLLGGSKPRQGR